MLTGEMFGVVPELADRGRQEVPVSSTGGAGWEWR